MATQPELAQAEIPAPVVAEPIASAPQQARKVRVIPLYNVPNAD